MESKDKRGGRGKDDPKQHDKIKKNIEKRNRRKTNTKKIKK